MIRWPLLALMLSLPAWAGELRHRSAVSWRTNLLGVGVFSDTGYRVNFYEGTTSPLLKGAYLEGGLVTQASPAAFHGGGYVQVVPVAPLQFRVQLQRLTYFGLFSALVDYPNTHAHWGPKHVGRSKARAQFGGGWAAMGSAQLRLKFGRLISLSELRLDWNRATGIPKGHAWYEPSNDLLVARSSLVLINKATLAMLVRGQLDGSFLLAGLHWERYHARRSEQLRHILGLVGLWRPSMDWWGEPSIGLLAGSFVVDRYRRGELYLGGVVAFGFKGPSTP